MPETRATRKSYEMTRTVVHEKKTMFKMQSGACLLTWHKLTWSMVISFSQVVSEHFAGNEFSC